MDDKTVTIVNIAVGAVNFVLIAVNVYMLVRARLVSLKVVPTIPQDRPALAGDRDTYEIRIEVTNLSQFPVYIREAGVRPRDSNDEPVKFVAPEGLTFPFELKPRESARLLPARNDDMRVSAGRFRCAYSKTACGRTRSGTSPSLQQQELNVYKSRHASKLGAAWLHVRHWWERIRY
ncbi:hypothetical protein AB3X96_18035 [Paraburkholderia sp. BR13439]|uniref:hypothetical protein n=1 Tax=Paraburkholderia sp. BR13439 TaxID=3236996 RepID=UPI0034CDE788